MDVPHLQTRGNATQIKITEIIRQWQKTFPDVNKATIKAIKTWRDDLQNKTAENKTDYYEQRLMEWPENLFYLLYGKLTEEERKYLFSKKGIRWAAREFPEYRLPEKT